VNLEVLSDNSPSFDDLIDERCDAFESAWRSGQRPSVVNFIGPQDAPIRNRLFRELLLVELECRRELGEQPTQEHYLREYPEFAAQVDSVSLRSGPALFSTSPENGPGAFQNVNCQPGRRIDHFELLERLGEGAMGQAWKAWDTRLQRNVTIKLPHSHCLAENELRRFLRESEAVAKLSHPQLSSIHEVRTIGNTFYIVAKYVDGVNLRDFVNGRQLSYHAIADLCAKTGDALQHVHDAGVVHRDLKPANIIVDPDGLPHIIDFGLAKIESADQDLTMNGELLGTPAYMSPELAGGHGDKAGSRTDIYSLGVILYELLAGRCPFKGSGGEVVSQILACDPAPPRSLRSTIPHDLETVCLKAIEKDPESRYATARDMSEDLRRYSAGLPIRARRVAVPEKCWRWICRHPAITASIALVVITVVVAGATISSLHERNRRLQGYRPVRVTTSPSGAHVAFVPIDPRTNEPSSDPADVIRLSETTPLVTSLKSGKYFVEAVLPGSDSSDFAEVYRTVVGSERLATSTVQTNEVLGLPPDTCHLSNIVIRSQGNMIKQMVAISIDETLRKSNATLPKVLYVDPQQITPADGAQGKGAIGKRIGMTADGTPFFRYAIATDWAESIQKRLPSAAEYEAIIAAVERGEARFVETGAPARMDDLFDDFPEFSTTVKTIDSMGGNRVRNFRDMHVLKGFKHLTTFSELYPWPDGTVLVGPDSKSPKVSIRGVRSGTPRFVKP